MSNIQKVSKRKIIHHGSKSLWNYTLSPGYLQLSQIKLFFLKGWSRDEVKILKKLLMKFGIGRWKMIKNANCLPGKSIAQIYMQTQRLVGQQSLGEFQNLHIHLDKVFQDNMKKTGMKRKNNCIINTGDNPNREQRKQQNESNRKKYGLTQEEIKNIIIPKVRSNDVENLYSIEEIESDKMTTIEKVNALVKLKKVVEKKIFHLKNQKSIEQEGKSQLQIKSQNEIKKDQSLNEKIQNIN